MSTVPLGFDLHLEYDHLLSPADRELHGILTVTARARDRRPAAGTDRPRLALVDGSESTARPPTGMPVAPTAAAIVVPQVRLRIRTVAPNRVLFCRQVHPTVRDLTGVPVDDRTVDHPTGSWGEERREYHLCLAVDGTDRPRDEDLLAARIDLMVADTAQTPPVAALVRWTDDPTLPGQVDPRTAYDTGRKDRSREVVDDGEGHDSDDLSAAGPLGRAVRLAAVAGDTRRLGELGLLVDAEDPAPGQVPGRADPSRPEPVGWSYPRHDGPPPAEPGATGGAVRTCRCGRGSPPGARYCERCGTEFDVPGPVPA
ncbi:zinc ribbon domain-containing protein [Micromonospora inyonensis]|uniref:Uncharacterized protein n=1 Tax=Micromonospora inyonensis TaxID=47866 RepID=A0A1C6RR06_9ACTN|nr:zinc ribbon domain-containing protein [Micromonospora inyonensis]SCL19594.1 hypothetical protein GA0074694_2749 [Micromonospora inyonensis]